MSFKFECMTAEQIYENFTTGRGTEDLAASGDFVGEAKTLYAELSTKIRSLTSDMESVWQGPAAGAATRGAGPLVVEHELAEPELDRVQYLTGRQVGSFNDAKGQVQPVPQVPQEPSVWDNITTLGGAGESYEQQVGQHRAATDANVRAMQVYEGASLHNGENMPRQYGQLQPDTADVAIGKPTATEPTATESDGRDTPPAPRRPGGGDDPVPVISEPVSRTGGYDGPTESSGWTPPTSGGQAPPVSGPVPTGPGPGGLLPVQPGVPTGPGFPGNRVPGHSQARSGARGEAGRHGPGAGRGQTAPGPGRAPGAGPGTAPGPDDRRVGGRFGAGPAPGQALAQAGAGAAGGGARSGAAGMPMGGAAGARGGEDEEHRRPSFLVEEDPDSLFGTDEITAPPVIGE